MVCWIVVALLVAPFALVHARRAAVAQLLPICCSPSPAAACSAPWQFVALHFTTALNMGLVVSAAPPSSWRRAGFCSATGSTPCRFGVLVSLSGVLAIVSRRSILDRLTSFSFNGGDLIIIANMTPRAIYSACLRLRPTSTP